jgi:hypothetical protein
MLYRILGHTDNIYGFAIINPWPTMYKYFCIKQHNYYNFYVR